mmetsp:Transcript_107426/g.181617  ORF Transcript_107426/g.181617 Transcript_107426/m.181617 type:complete len:285 (-) Transcript_107426:109-963(-)
MLQEDIPSLGLDDVLLPLQAALHVVVPLQQHLQLLFARALQLGLPPLHALAHGHQLRPVPRQDLGLLLRVLLGTVAVDLLELHRLHFVRFQLHFVGVGVALGPGQRVLDFADVQQLFGELGPLRSLTGHLRMEFRQLHAVALQHRGLTVQLVLLEGVDLLIPNAVEILKLEHVRLLEALPLVLLLLRQRRDVPVLLLQPQLLQHVLHQLGLLVVAAPLAAASVLGEDLDVLVQWDVRARADGRNLLQNASRQDLLLLIVDVGEGLGGGRQQGGVLHRASFPDRG